MPLVVARVRALARERGTPVALVGWSRRGHLVREEPSLVRHVGMIGSPIVGGPRYTAIAPWYRGRDIDVNDLEAQVDERYRVPPPVLTTTLYIKRDGVVNWWACIDAWSPQVENVSVRSVYVGRGLLPEMVAIVADWLGACDAVDSTCPTAPR